MDDEIKTKSGLKDYAVFLEVGGKPVFLTGRIVELNGKLTFYDGDGACIARFISFAAWLLVDEKVTL